MQKKDTTSRKGRATSKAKTIRQRAQAIIANKRRYDSDTREAIFNALTTKASDLKDYIIRAERGETILDITAPPASEFLTVAREANIARRGFPLDYEREAAQIASYLESEETPQAVRDLIEYYVMELGSSTNVGVWTPAVLRAAYPIMRYRDGASDGARVLLGIAIDAITSEDERERLRAIWKAAREKLDAGAVV
jgi:hypothetical protein